MKKINSVILSIILTICAVIGLSGAADAADTAVSPTGMGTESHFNYYWTEISGTNSMGSSQAITFSTGGGMYTSSTDIYNRYSYGYLISPLNNVSGYIPKSESGLTIDYVKSHYTSKGSYDKNTDTVTVNISEPGIYYGACMHERYEKAPSISLEYKDHHYCYDVTDNPVYAYKTTLDANGGTSQYDYLITVNTPYTENYTVYYTAKECEFPVPTREGYSCVGWSKNKTDKTGVWSITPESNETYYAIWQKNGIVGDVDSNGEVDIVDATYIQRRATMISVPFSNDDMMFGDVDGSGEVTVIDATFIQRYATHIKVPYPIGEEKTL